MSWVLTSHPVREQPNQTTANTVVGIGVPYPEAHQRPSHDAGAFFGPAVMGHPLQWRAVCGGRKARRSSGRYANRAPSVSPIGVGAADLTPEDTAMPQASAQQREDRIIANAQRIIHRRWQEPGEVLDFDRARLFFTLRLHALDREVFEVAYLDTAHRLLACERLFAGTVDAAVVHPREVVRAAMQHNAVAVIVAHNHPSGALKPSIADRQITSHIARALALVDVRLLDHVIVGRKDATSFVGDGLRLDAAAKAGGRRRE